MSYPFQMRSPFRRQSPFGGAVNDNYIFGGQSAALVIDDAGVRNNGVPYYRANGARTTHKGVFGTARRRSDAATMPTEDGLKWSPHNLLSHSEQFDNAAWTKGDMGVTANAATAPNGTSTADLLTPDATNTFHRVIRAETTSPVASHRIFVKAAGYTKVALRESKSGSDYASFELSGSGTLLDSAGAGASATITALDDDWYVILMPDVEPAISHRFTLFVLSPSYTTGSPTASWTPNGTDGVYAWGAHLYRSDLGGMQAVYSDERGLSTDATYVPTTTAAVFLERREAYRYNGSSWVIDGHIQEPATTNLDPNSDDLSAWTTSNTTIAKNQTGAGGNANTAHLISATANNGTALEQITASSASHVWSCLMKRVTGSGTVEVTVNGGTNWIDITSQINSSAFIQVGTTPVTVTNPEFGVRLGASGDAVAVQISQLEQTSGQYTSPFPTVGSTATRATDPNTDQVVAAKLPWSSTANWVSYAGRISYADNGATIEATFFRRLADGSNLFRSTLLTSAVFTGLFQGTVLESATTDSANSDSGEQATPGVGVPFSVAVRLVAESSGGAGDGEIQTANDGVAGTANTTVGALPDLSSENLDLGQAGFSGSNHLIMAGTGDIGAVGLAEASA